ncbi:MAG: DUF362 domain-containing protein [Candidatus Firestonebacteria bacterium]
MKSKVAVLKTKPESVLQDIKRLMQLADFDKVLDKNKVTILKDNISWHFPFLSSNTTPWQLEGVILALKEAGFKDIVAVHNNTVVTNPYKGGKLNKLDPIYKKYNVEEKYNFKPKDIKWIKYTPKTKMLVLNKIYPEGIKIPEFFLNKNIIHLPTVKTHIYTTTTGAMKNAFGGLLNTRRHYAHSYIHETLVDLLAIQKEIHSGIFAVMDGTICGSGPGPRTMIPYEKDYILASSDSVAIDSVSAKIMGFNPMEISYINLANDLKLGNADLINIEIIGENISNVNFNFKVGNNIPSHIGHTLWFGPLKKIQKLFFRTPLVYLFVFSSFFYHDFIWWPLIGKKIQKEMAFNTKWGKLFQKY